jgi:hypothetical protein
LGEIAYPGLASRFVGKVGGADEQVIRIRRFRDGRPNRFRDRKERLRSVKEGRFEPFGIEPKFRVIGISGRVVRSSRSARSSDEVFGVRTVERDESAPREGVVGIVLDEASGRFRP